MCWGSVILMQTRHAKLRDLDVLEKQDAMVKIRGRARAVRHAGDIGFDERMQENNSGKSTIAQKAISLIQPHSSVFLYAKTDRLRSYADLSVLVCSGNELISVDFERSFLLGIGIATGAARSIASIIG